MDKKIALAVVLTLLVLLVIAVCSSLIIVSTSAPEAGTMILY